VRDDLISGLSRDFGVHPYGKWRGAFWRLISLVELGVEPGDPRAFAAAKQSPAWLCNPRRLKTIHQRRIEGRVRRCASQDGRGLQASLRIGLRGDPRLDTLAESLVETQWPDGGWNCDLRPEASHSSFNESWGPISVSRSTGPRRPSRGASTSCSGIAWRTPSEPGGRPIPCS
jgi:hypothetical protein